MESIPQPNIPQPLTPPPLLSQHGVQGALPVLSPNASRVNEVSRLIPPMTLNQAQPHVGVALALNSSKLHSVPPGLVRAALPPPPRLEVAPYKTETRRPSPYASLPTSVQKELGIYQQAPRQERLLPSQQRGKQGPITPKPLQKGTRSQAESPVKEATKKGSKGRSFFSRGKSGKTPPPLPPREIKVMAEKPGPSAGLKASELSKGARTERSVEPKPSRSPAPPNPDKHITDPADLPRGAVTSKVYELDDFDSLFASDPEVGGPSLSDVVGHQEEVSMAESSLEELTQSQDETLTVQEQFASLIGRYAEISARADSLEAQFRKAKRFDATSALEIHTLRNQAQSLLSEASSMIGGETNSSVKYEMWQQLRRVSPQIKTEIASRFTAAGRLAPDLERRTPTSSVGKVWSHLGAFAAFYANKSVPQEVRDGFKVNLEEALVSLNRDVRVLHGNSKTIMLSIELSALSQQIANALKSDNPVEAAQAIIKENMPPSDVESGVISNYTLAFGSTYPFIDKDDAEKQDAIKSVANSYNLLMKFDEGNLASLQQLQQTTVSFAKLMPTLRDSFVPFFETTATHDKVLLGAETPAAGATPEEIARIAAKKEQLTTTINAAGGKDAVLSKIDQVKAQLAEYRKEIANLKIESDVRGYSKGSLQAKAYLETNLDKVEKGLNQLAQHIRNS